MNMEFQHSNIDETDQMKTSETDQMKTSETDQMKTSETDQMKISETDQIKTSETDEVYKKRQRKVMTLEKKIEVLDRLANGETAASVGRLMGVNESTIRTIKKKEIPIRMSVAGGTPKSSKVMYKYMPRDDSIEKVEKVLSIWIDEQIQNNKPLYVTVIREIAKQLYMYFVEALPLEQRKHKTNSFQASKGWFEKFQKRHSLQHIKIMGDAGNHFEGFLTLDTEIQSIIETVTNLEHMNEAEELISRVECVLEEMIPPSNENQGEIVENKINPDDLNKGLLMAKSLSDFFLEIDKDEQRSHCFKRGLKKILEPYTKLEKDLEENV